jgi:hypothetical protein
MPSGILDIVEGIFELFDCLTAWRFWLPFLLAAVITMVIIQNVENPVICWMLGVPVVLAGIVGGLAWHLKNG